MNRRHGIAGGAFLLVVALLVFLPLLRSGFFVVTFDDDAFVIDNPNIRALSWEAARAWFGHFHHADYVPVALASFAIDYQLWGLWAGGYHLTNIVLHLLASGLAALLIARAGGRADVALLAGGLFALHPLQLEAVAIISQRKTLLATIFALLALLAYGRYLRRRRAGWYAAALACFAAGGLAKSSLVALPLLLWLYEAHRRIGGEALPGGKHQRPPFWISIPFLMIAAVLAWVGIASKADIGVIKTAHGGSPVVTALLMGRVWIEYLAAFVAPVSLSPAYYYRISSAYSPWHAAALAVAAAGHVLLWRHRRRWPLTCFALFWFSLSMLPVANIVPIAVVRADRYMHLGLVGLAWWAAHGIAAVARGAGLRPPIRLAAGVLLVAAVGLVTAPATRWWASDVTIWQRAAAVHPWSSRAHLLLGHAYRNAGMLQPASEALRLAAALDPAYAPPHVLLAEMLLDAGDARGAAEEARTAAALAPGEALPESLLSLLKGAPDA